MGIVMGMIMDPFPDTSFYSIIVEVKAAANAPICLSRLCGGCVIMNMGMIVGVCLG